MHSESAYSGQDAPVISRQVADILDIELHPGWSLSLRGASCRVLARASGVRGWWDIFREAAALALSMTSGGRRESWLGIGVCEQSSSSASTPPP